MRSVLRARCRRVPRSAPGASATRARWPSATRIRSGVVSRVAQARASQARASSNSLLHPARSSAVSAIRVLGGIAAGCRAWLTRLERWIITPEIAAHMLVSGTVTWISQLWELVSSLSSAAVQLAQHRIRACPAQRRPETGLTIRLIR